MMRWPSWKTGFFDFAILDLKIPTAEGTTDFDPEHGKYVFQHVRNVSPGTKNPSAHGVAFG